MAKLRITLVKSPIACQPRQKKTVEALGLRKLNHSVELRILRQQEEQSTKSPSCSK